MNIEIASTERPQTRAEIYLVVVATLLKSDTEHRERQTHFFFLGPFYFFRI
jgi:hypothetical protein